MASVFGVEVSGMVIADAPLLKEIDRGPEWLTGLDYGLEGGIACPVALAAALAFVATTKWLKAESEMRELTSPGATSTVHQARQESS